MALTNELLLQDEKIVCLIRVLVKAALCLLLLFMYEFPPSFFVNASVFSFDPGK